MADNIASKMLPRSLLALAAGGVLAAFVFLSWPEIDIFVAASFADGTLGFALRFHPVPRFFNDLINVAAALSAMFIIAGWSLAARLKISIAGLWPQHYGFLFASLAIGPGLIANGIFKENWGRARPRNIEAFGGEAVFSPALLISDQCDRNCSFVSGDASMGFFFLALAMVVPKKYRKLAIVAALLFGAFIGFMRIIQGAHFLSDVTFAGIFVALTICTLYKVMLSNWQAPARTQPPFLVQAGFRGGAKTPTPPGRTRRWVFLRAGPEDLGVRK